MKSASTRGGGETTCNHDEAATVRGMRRPILRLCFNFHLAVGPAIHQSNVGLHSFPEPTSPVAPDKIDKEEPCGGGFSKAGSLALGSERLGSDVRGLTSRIPRIGKHNPGVAKTWLVSCSRSLVSCLLFAIQEVESSSPILCSMKCDKLSEQEWQ
jgi:hypothetical protein